MRLTKQQVREMARIINLDIPEADLENIRLRLSTLFTSMEEIESELGREMDKTDPIPPVYPHDEF